MIVRTKTMSVIAAAIVACTMMSGCASSGASNDPEPSSSAEGGIAVEEKFLDVVVTLPASFFEDMNAEEIQTSAEESGYKAVVNDDGSVEYTIPKSVHAELIAEMASGIDDSIAETLSTEASIEEITHDDKFATFAMTVDRAAFEDSFSAQFIPFSLGLQAMLFQSFDGISLDDRRVVVTYIDSASGEEFDTYELPDALE
ncbi:MULTISPECIES: hypothetical protein [unclassified Salinibacterium]|uniref:hypothetical protein n=1 Tax=unclassified Salinibacterium TaxID=2632331 RepID=UPI0018CFD28C|nr:MULTISPECIES: hypothetical protein [unclassified Salinibacterium]MBH0052752.1 hypothetical protein [Salinibacterium sp. SWN139]MBH0082014.1 hypothetical protein [Salinibacterium sp. SWN167]